MGPTTHRHRPQRCRQLQHRAARLQREWVGGEVGLVSGGGKQRLKACKSSTKQATQDQLGITISQPSACREGTTHLDTASTQALPVLVPGEPAAPVVRPEGPAPAPSGRLNRTDPPGRPARQRCSGSTVSSRHVEQNNGKQLVDLQSLQVSAATQRWPAKLPLLRLEHPPESSGRGLGERRGEVRCRLAPGPCNGELPVRSTAVAACSASPCC